jgi:hypothetical protein
MKTENTNLKTGNPHEIRVFTLSKAFVFTLLKTEKSL